ncbi:Protein COBRA [Glycine soja]
MGFSLLPKATIPTNILFLVLLSCTCFTSTGNQEGLERFARAWILRFVGGVIFVDKSSKRVHLKYLQFLRDLRECSSYAWGAAILDSLYREIWLGGELHHIDNDNLIEFRRKLDVMKCDEQPIPGPVMQPNNIHDLTLKRKEGKNWMQLMQPTLNEWNSRYERRVEQTPPQTGTLSLNSEYMRWYKREIAETLHFMVSPVGRRICTFDDLLPCIEKITLLSEEEDRILETHEDAPPSQPQFEHQHVETRGLARRRETIDAPTYSLPPMPERQHGIYYTPPAFTQEPSQMLSIFAGIFGSSPPSTGTPSFTQSGQVSTPNAPLAGPWNVPGDIPDMDNLLGVDLRHDFSVEADQVDERANLRRRNPDRAARNWDRPCGTSSRHHRHNAYNPLDPNGNITIKWDVISWTPDGYVALVTMNNFQRYRHIASPGWSMGWTWAKKEVIWSMMGGQTTEQGDCSKFKGGIPHCCKKDPTVVDLLPGTPYNQQIANCCKGGVLSSWVQDPTNAVSSFQVSVGRAGTTNRTVKVPKNFTLKAPGPGYTCGPAKIVAPTKFITSDKRRVTQALMTWKVVCTYSIFLAHKTPTCCVSLSSFHNNTIVPCPTCSCGCRSNSSQSGRCGNPDTPHLASVVAGSGKNNFSPLVQCTHHMCPVRIHWHVKLNYKEYWRVKVTITNFNYRMNYSEWNMVVQHPNFDNLTQLFSFNYKSLTPYGSINDTAMLWGVKFYNDFLNQAGPNGNVQSELLFRKDKATFTFDKGWAFPRRIYFNGDNCVMPPPDAYPWLPNAGARQEVSLFALVIASLVALVFYAPA